MQKSQSCWIENTSKFWNYILNKETAEMEKVGRYILKHSLQNKPLEARFITDYGFETVILEIDEQSKLRELRENKVKLFAVEFSEFIAIRFSLAVQYLECVGRKNKCFFYNEVDCLDAFVKKMEEISSDLETFPRKITDINDKAWKRKIQCCKTLVFIWWKDLTEKIKIKTYVRDHCHYTGKYSGAVHLLRNICNIKNIPSIASQLIWIW